MLTKEQIKNLKKGDIICMHVPFDSLTEEKFRFKTPTFPNDYFLPPTPPKYAPTRRFKRGDVVRVVAWHGRAPKPIMNGTNLFGMDEIVTVEEDEDVEYNVLVKGKSARQVFHSCHLELVTPVEELESYFILDSPHTFNICKHGGSKFAATFYKDHPLAREHAEKYCAALNAEHRKEAQQ